MDSQKWEDEIQEARQQKDAFFKSYQSPIDFDEINDFQGLSYYPPDIDYRFELELAEYQDKKSLQVEDTKGNIRNFIRYGEFTFALGGTECKLQAYKSDLEESRLFIPFKDATSGKETYPAGRYMDVDAESGQFIDGRWILDFNLAYNPWCAYSEKFGQEKKNILMGKRIKRKKKHGEDGICLRLTGKNVRDAASV
jgi:uncharacterized protein (DUF1684 family)